MNFSSTPGKPTADRFVRFQKRRRAAALQNAGAQAGRVAPCAPPWQTRTCPLAASGAQGTARPTRALVEPAAPACAKLAPPCHGVAPVLGADEQRLAGTFAPRVEPGELVEIDGGGGLKVRRRHLRPKKAAGSNL
jgi:hypothetical protein